MSFQLRQIGEFFLLVPMRGGCHSIYFLNQTAYVIYHLWEEGKSPSEIVLALRSKFRGVSLNVIKRDVYSVLSLFKDKELQASQEITFSANVENELRDYAKKNQIPVEGTFELTFRCNLRCVHCYCVHCDWKEPQLNTRQVLSAIDEMVDMGCLWLLFTGGEPLLREDFKDIYLHTKKKGVIVSIFTNGLLIDKDLCQIFNAHPPFLLELCLYGISNATYYAITGNRNGFSKFVESCDLLDQYKIDYLLKSMIHQRNNNELNGMQAFARERGKRFRYDAEIRSQLDGKDVQDNIRLAPKEVLHVEIREGAQKSIDAWLSSREGKRRVYKDELFFCNAGKTSFNVDPFGNVSMCGRVRSPSFSIRAVPFRTIWDQLVQFGQQPAPKDFVCRSCQYIDFCKTCPGVYMMDRIAREREYCNLAKEREKAICEMTDNGGDFLF